MQNFVLIAGSRSEIIFSKRTGRGAGPAMSGLNLIVQDGLSAISVQPISTMRIGVRWFVKTDILLKNTHPVDLIFGNTLPIQLTHLNYLERNRYTYYEGARPKNTRSWWFLFK